MNPEEYANLAKVEAAHWYYRGKRILVREWINRLAGEAAAGGRLLDCGAGTGLFASEMADQFEVHVADDHAESLALLARRFPPECVHRVTAAGVEAEPESFAVVTALDVLEHIEKDAQAVEGMRRLLRPGGILVATVPASMALWSDWDESLHHWRRYDRAGLRQLFGEGWEVLHLNYTNVVVYPVVWGIRRLRGIRRRRGCAGERSEDRLPPRLLNLLLRKIFVGTGLSRVRVPFGVSLLVVARRSPSSGGPLAVEGSAEVGNAPVTADSAEGA